MTGTCNTELNEANKKIESIEKELELSKSRIAAIEGIIKTTKRSRSNKGSEHMEREQQGMYR